MDKLLFITTSSLASNPRLVKEFESLKQYYKCTVVCFKHYDWSLELSEKIKLRNTEIEFVEIDRKEKLLPTVISKLKHKVSIKLNSLFRKNIKVCATASNDKTPQLISVVRKLSRSNKYYRVIGHNLGAFLPALLVSEKSNIDLQLDVEDFHPGEALYFNKSYERENRHFIMGNCLNKAKYITFASKGIALECNKRYNIDDTITQLIIINAFENEDFIKPKRTTELPVKTVWFSQHIGPNRGLEQVFEAAKCNPKIEFNFIGNIQEAYISSIELSDNIKFHPIMPQQELHQFLSTMDIGLALESKSADLNRDICLTNKFLAYLQAGLYIFATDTFGQRDFIKSMGYDAGQIIGSDLANELSLLDNKVLSYESKLKRWQLAKAFSWEQEQLKLLKIFK